MNTLQADYPFIAFHKSARGYTYWSAEQQIVHYYVDGTTIDASCADLLHEVGHALLFHYNYLSDLQLLAKEIEAWTVARYLSGRYSVSIANDYIEDSLDSYRNWLYKRSRCPDCDCSALQQSNYEYVCLNCAAHWQVSRSQICRPYRKILLNSKSQPQMSGLAFVE